MIYDNILYHIFRMNVSETDELSLLAQSRGNRCQAPWCERHKIIALQICRQERYPRARGCWVPPHAIRSS